MNFHVHIWQSNVRLFWNAITEKNVFKNINLLGSLVPVVR